MTLQDTIAQICCLFKKKNKKICTLGVVPLFVSSASQDSSALFQSQNSEEGGMIGRCIGYPNGDKIGHFLSKMLEVLARSNIYFLSSNM